MKKLFYSSILILLFQSFLLSAPVIVFDKTEIDMGEVKTDSSYTLVFTFRNEGTSTLVIERVRTG